MLTKITNSLKVKAEDTTLKARLRLLYIVPFFVLVFVPLAVLGSLAVTLDLIRLQASTVARIWNHDPFQARVAKILRSLLKSA